MKKKKMGKFRTSIAASVLALAVYIGMKKN